MHSAGRGILAGAGFGLAVAAVVAWLQLVAATFSRIPPAPMPVAYGALADLVALTVLGLVLAPLLRLRAGRLLHLLALVAVWFAVQTALSIDSPMFRYIVQAGPLIALPLAGLGLWIARRSRLVAIGLGALLFAGGLAAPHVYLALTTPAEPPRAELGAPPPDAPDVVLIVLDTVRAANVSAYGYDRPTTPVFDSLAGEGALFLDATSPSTWSLASHASLFTGLFPSGHGAHWEHLFLDAGPPTLAEVLTAAGYTTRTLTANAFIGDTLGLTRGFQFRDEPWRRRGPVRMTLTLYRILDRLGYGVDDKGGAAVVADFERWAAETPRDRPAFVFLNFIEAHFPYHLLPDDYLWRFTSRPRSELYSVSMEALGTQFGGPPPADPDSAVGLVTDMYDGGIVYTDYLLGRVIDALRRRGTLDRTVLVVMSDHGELLGEHGSWGHGMALYEPGIRVPMLVRYPPRIAAGTRVETPVSTVGVFATVLDLIGLAPPAPLHVGSLLPALTGGPPGGPVLSERHVGPRSVDGADPIADPAVRIRTYRMGRLKLVERSDGQTFLFDLSADPGETFDLADSRPAEVARLRDELDSWRAALGIPAIDAVVERSEPPELDPEARERLRALGYVE